MTTLREARQAKDWSLAELAQAAHMSKASISRIERGERRPTYRTRRDLAAALDVAVEAIEWPEEGSEDESD